MKKIDMKKFFCLLFLILTLPLISSSPSYAFGGLTHMFIATKVIQQLSDDRLRSIILNNYDAYLVGAYYPDSGYIKGTGYGEDSHDDPFIYTSADYIKKIDPTLTQNQKLIAFLFGCAAHRVSDEGFHSHLVYSIAQHDTPNNSYKLAHSRGDNGIDILVNLDHNQWLNYPRIWWVPVSHLVKIYQLMGKPEYKAENIIHGNAIIYFAGIGERMITLFAYPFWRYQLLPWTAKNYMTCPNYGINQIEKDTVNYQMQLWNYLLNRVDKPTFAKLSPAYQMHPSSSPMQAIESAVARGQLAIRQQVHANDGSVEIHSAMNEKSMRDILKQIWRH